MLAEGGQAVKPSSCEASRYAIEGKRFPPRHEGRIPAPVQARGKLCAGMADKRTAFFPRLIFPITPPLRGSRSSQAARRR
ncbi:MAG: hypothetical protein OXU61_07110, partial [Gammaproteobacteria bacterium]|nr:hypothetical protein [Gammaproteobacteria bacterium]